MIWHKGTGGISLPPPFWTPPQPWQKRNNIKDMLVPKGKTVRGAVLFHKSPCHTLAQPRAKVWITNPDFPSSSVTYILMSMGHQSKLLTFQILLLILFLCPEIFLYLAILIDSALSAGLFNRLSHSLEHFTHLPQIFQTPLSSKS